MLILHLDLSSDKCFPQSYEIFLLQLPCSFEGKNTSHFTVNRKKNQAKIMWPEEGKIFRLKNYDRHNKSLFAYSQMQPR